MALALLHSLLGILAEQGIMLHDQEAVVVLQEDGYELEGSEGPAHLLFSAVAIPPAESCGPLMKRILWRRQFQVAAGISGRCKGALAWKPDNILRFDSI